MQGYFKTRVPPLSFQEGKLKNYFVFVALQSGSFSYLTNKQTTKLATMALTSFSYFLSLVNSFLLQVTWNERLVTALTRAGSQVVTYATNSSRTLVAKQHCNLIVVQNLPLSHFTYRHYFASNIATRSRIC